MPDRIDNNQERNKPTDKRPYEKPVLKAVDLHADEIMGGCRLEAPCTGPSVPVGPISGEG